ncbi:MAG: protein kinase [Deltaproteobacteria bacterium]|nr:protein kinase [Deltaproteobacteria bacterium]
MTTTGAPSTTADLDLQAGEQVGEYVVEGKLGQGGFGAVFKAQHPLIGKVVAIKVLARKFSVDPEMVARFIAEARAVNQIRHRNIIDIFSFGQLADGRHYYVMEYLEGEPLDALIDQQKLLVPQVALPILRQVARALDAAHGKGIAHRDLKPENVFLGRDPDGDGFTVKLLDFGIAKLLAADDGSKVKTRTGMPIGTPYYMSPEQCRGKDVDHRTDYYAFGIVTYQLLTGAYPFDADDFMTILMKQMSEEPVPPSHVNPALPPAIDEVVAWLMKKDPAQRPPNLVTAVKALEAACEGGGISVPRPSAAWETPTPQPGGGTAPTLPAQRSMTPHALGATAPHALAATMPSGTMPPVSAPVAAKSPLLWIVGGVGALAIGAVVFFVMRGSHADKAPPPPPPVVQQQPVVAPPPPPVVIDAAVPAVAPPPVVIDAPAATVPAITPPPPTPKKPPHPPAGTKPPGSHDSHSIEDPFAK